MTNIPNGFRELLEASVGPEHAEKVLRALEQAPSASIRLNPAQLTECPFPDAIPILWSPYGYLLKERPVFTLDPLFHAGCYYVQDTSAMFVGHVFRQVTGQLQPGCRVLDLCAAPGGKTTDLAASLRERFGNRFTLISNEVMRNRCAVLRANVETWGDERVSVVSRDPSAFGDEPVFDAILADVPCSGEGMFRKDEQAVAEWSPKTVEFCAARSRRILADIWPTLVPGGILVYSTCTFNHMENDDTVAWMAAELGAEVLQGEEILRFAQNDKGGQNDRGEQNDKYQVVSTQYGYLLLPGLVPGEGQYVAALRKAGCTTDAQRTREGQKTNARCTTDAQRTRETPEPEGRCDRRSIGSRFCDGERASLRPETNRRGGNATPALPDSAPLVNVNRATALQYLHGDAIVLPADAPLGPVTIGYQGHPLGPAKNLGKRCNNLYPKNKRIRMDIR